MRWYFEKDGAEQGPFEAKEAPTLVRVGVLTADTRVRNEGSEQWQKLSDSGIANALPKPLGTPETGSRHVSGGLIVGMLAFPILAVWFLLGKGYSTRARVLGFSWLALTLAPTAMAASALLRANIEVRCSVQGTGQT